MHFFRPEIIRNPWLLAFLGCLVFATVTVTLNLPSQISTGEKGQAAIQMLDAMRRPFLEIKTAETLLIGAGWTKMATSDFNKAVESGNNLLARYRRLAEYNPELSRRVAQLAEAYEDWLSAERKLFDHFRDDFISENSPLLHAHIIKDLHASSAGFLNTMDLLGEGEITIHEDISKGRMATHILLTSLSLLFLYLIGLIFIQQRAKTRELELKVEESTRDLKEANKSLEQEIREHKKVQEEVENSLSLLNATLESTADGILVVNDEGKIISFNQKFVDMWRIPEIIVASRDDNQALAYVLDQLKDPEVFIAKVRELYSQPDAESFDLLEFRDGRVFERYSRPQRIGERVVGRVWSFRDVTERKVAEEKIKHMAYHDPLTDLPNRALFFDRLHQAILVGQREKGPVALILFDLDGFKEINDTAGHHYGDLALQAVGQRLRGIVRKSDTIARLGGDEFALLLPGTNKEGATLIAHKILETLKMPFALEGKGFDIGVSIGIALFPDHSDDANLLLQKADRAMYIAKGAGRGYAIYVPEKQA